MSNMNLVGGTVQSSQFPYGIWVLAAAIGVCIVVAIVSPWLKRRVPHAWWAVWGFPSTALRVVWTWRRLADLQGLSVARRPPLALVGGVVLRGRALRPVKPRMGFPRWQLGGLVVEVRLHPGQTPEEYAAAAESMAHAWRVFSVRVVSEQRGTVRLSALAWDPLVMPFTPLARSAGFLSAVVGIWEDGAWWRIDLRKVPHWLIVGATRSGKSTLIAALVHQWSRQRAALVGIDLKGGMELSLFGPRLTALASTRSEAADLLDQLVEITLGRMALCRMEGVRSVWELPERERPVPVIVLVDEVAELYLMASTADKAEVARVSTAMLRIGQLGAALGVHLVLAGQRFGSELGSGVTSLRAQLGGRVCFRVMDEGTAEMVLGDIDSTAVDAAQMISEDYPGLAVALGAPGGGWRRARTHAITTRQAEEIAKEFAHLTPAMVDLYPASVGGVGGE
ncbi:FtsK/SpoIIIE domain-containing protein [Kitasatospora acidiphila]|uniref:FtsK/SpoIIIE domain-containing protein n=1 Tax=Kitasatospora acidiphila TaxID=2567942 RepID=UPI003C78385B